jgi:hypothetical protein
MAGLQLSYSFMTVPSVLQAGADAQLTIVVSNAGAPVTVVGIDFTLRDGPGARDIVNGVTPTTQNMPDGWSHPDPTGGKFSMTPATPVEISRQGLLFTFNLTVNAVVGMAIIDITEHLQVQGSPHANRGNLSVPKFPQEFKLSGFYSTTPIINQGDSVTLVWTGENLDLANYSLSYSAAGGKKVVDIPARTYSYTVDDVESTSVFYLHVMAAQSNDTTFTFQASDYPITVDPAIMEFWSGSSFAPPGGSVTLSWKVSDTVTQGTVTCLQSGQTWPLDAAALAKGALSITTPAISMVCDYVLDVFEDGSGVPLKVASRALQIQISSSIPRPSGSFGQFFTDNQASDLAAPPVPPAPPPRLITDDVVPPLIEQIFAQFKIYYPDVDFYLDWSNDKVNAQSFVYLDKRKKIVLFGGLARRPCLFYEGLCFIVAQCVSRLSGQQPATQGITYVGAADFYATSILTGSVFYAITGDSDLISGISTQIQALFNGISDANQQGDPNDLPNYPAIGCRKVALQNGIFGESLPPCVSNPTQ